MGVLSLIRPCRPQQVSIMAIRYTRLPNLTSTRLNLAPAATASLRQFTTSAVHQSGDHRTFTITPSRYAWNKYKDSLHFYVMLGLIPGLIVVFLVNVFVGPAKLAPIPAGYVPKQEEYFKHPITRWLVRNFFTSHQEDYERNLFYFWEEDEKRKMRILEARVEELMAYRGDYPNYYVRPTISGKYFRYNVEEVKELQESRGQEIEMEDLSIPSEK